jgi:hypothetical protein
MMIDVSSGQLCIRLGNSNLQHGFPATVQRPRHDLSRFGVTTAPALHLVITHLSELRLSRLALLTVPTYINFP